LRYHKLVIRSFNDKNAEAVWNRRNVKALGPEISRAGYKKLLILDAAADINDLRVPPGNRLEKLVGDREGQYSIRINGQYRLCFTWKDGGADGVEIVDYH
jgi:proteic killer suppression protein